MGVTFSTTHALAWAERAVKARSRLTRLLHALGRLVYFTTGIRKIDLDPFFRLPDAKDGTVLAIFRYLLQIFWGGTRLLINLVAPTVVARQLFAAVLLNFLLHASRRIVGIARHVRGRFDPTVAAVLKYEARMEAATSYAEWRRAARKVDAVTGADVWRRAGSDGLFDEAAVQSRTALYRTLLGQGNLPTLMFILRAGLLRKHWGIDHPDLYAVSRVGTKKLLEKYVETVAAAMKTVSRAPSETPQELAERVAFTNETRHAYGRSALCLSGGATMGLYHIGVVRELLDQGLLPRVIAGSSAGSIVAAIVGVRTDEEIADDLTLDNLDLSFFGIGGGPPKSRHGDVAEGGVVPGSSGGSHDEEEEEEGNAGDAGSGRGGGDAAGDPEPRGLLAQLWNYVILFLPPPLGQLAGAVRRWVPGGVARGSLLDIRVLARCLRANIGDMTFQEAYDRTGRIINITVTGLAGKNVPVLLNYLSAPNVLVWSAVTASCAIPGVFEAVELLAKDSAGHVKAYHSEGQRWIDGSVESDLPFNRLAELFNVNQYIASQCNPHAPLLFQATGTSAPVRLYGFLQRQLKAFAASISELLRDVPGCRGLVRGFVPIVTQKYQGDVTFTPRFRPHDLLELLQNPDGPKLQRAVEEGRRMVWPHITWIRMHCLIEFTLDDCVRELRARMAGVDPERGRGLSRVVSFHTSRSILNLGDLDPGAPGIGSPALKRAGFSGHGPTAGGTGAGGGGGRSGGGAGGVGVGPMGMSGSMVALPQKGSLSGLLSGAGPPARAPSVDFSLRKRYPDASHGHGVCMPGVRWRAQPERDLDRATAVRQRRSASEHRAPPRVSRYTTDTFVF